MKLFRFKSAIAERSLVIAECSLVIIARKKAVESAPAYVIERTNACLDALKAISVRSETNPLHRKG